MKTLIALSFLASLVACATDDDTTPPTVLPRSAQVTAPTSTTEPAEAVVPGEPDEVAAKDCVYVQWCNAPGPNGTVCQLRSSCTISNAAIDECISDANYVCGSVVHPFVLYY